MTYSQQSNSARLTGVAIAALALMAAGIVYRVLVWRHLEQTSLLFMGIPAFLAVALASGRKTKTVTGGIMRATAIGLLLSGPLLGEGFICIVMAAPIFFLVAAAVGLLVDWCNRKNRSAILPCLVLLGLGPMTLEGTHPRLSLNREETVTVTRSIAASPEEVAAALAQSPRLDQPIPFFGRLGFPRPTESHGEGLQPGALRTTHFAGGEGHPGDLVMEVAESRPGHALFRVVSDHSKIAHWMDWKSSEVDWRSADPWHTQVTWTIRFHRSLDPAWYFRPWERFAVSLSADYLIQTNAT